MSVEYGKGVGAVVILKPRSDKKENCITTAQLSNAPPKKTRLKPIFYCRS